MIEEVNDTLDFFNPSMEFLNQLRTINVLIGLIGCIVLLFCLAVPRWKNWNVPTRLGWMSLFLLCFAGTYGTFEVRYLNTELRVPMVTVALLWALCAALYPLYESLQGALRKKKR